MSDEKNQDGSVAVGSVEIDNEATGGSTSIPTVPLARMGSKVGETILNAILNHPNIGANTNVIEQFARRFNKFGFTQSYGQAPYFIELSNYDFDKQFGDVSGTIDTLAPNEVEQTWSTLSHTLVTNLSVLAERLDQHDAYNKQSFGGFVHPIDHDWPVDTSSRADLDVLVNGASNADRGHLWLVAPAGGGKSVKVFQMFNSANSTGLVLRVMEPFQAKYDHADNVIQVASTNTMIVLSAFLSFVGVDHAIDGARNWYSSLVGKAAMLGLSDSLPFAITNWNNLTAHMGYGRA